MITIGGSVPLWYRIVIIVISVYGVGASLMFLVGFLMRVGSKNRTSMVVLDQYLLFIAGGVACLVYGLRWLFWPPDEWSGLVLGLMVISLVTLVDVAFTIRLVLWNRARRDWTGSLSDHDRSDPERRR